MHRVLSIGFSPSNEEEPCYSVGDIHPAAQSLPSAFLQLLVSVHLHDAGLSQKIQPDGGVRTHSCSATLKAAQYGIRTGK